MENKISVAMVIHNEEKHLHRSLESVSSISDDIIIIHDGKCTDSSFDIANKFNAKFYERKFIGIAEGHRIDSFNLTLNNWILVLDADEVLSVNLISDIPKLINDSSVDAYEFVWPSFDGTKVVCSGWPKKKALFRKSKIKYIDFPQADVKTNGRLVSTSYILHHFPTYNNFTFNSFKSKWIKWVNIQANAILKDFNQFQKIGYDKSENNWSKYFLFKKKYPEFFILYGIYDFYKSLISGVIAGGSLHAVKSSFMWGAYNALVYYKVLKLKWIKS